MPYSFQTFSVGQVLTAAQVNQIEVNVRDHQHGVAGVSSSGQIFVAPDLGTPAAGVGTNLTGIPASALLMAPIKNSLVGDVAINNASNFFDGPSIAQGASGTWYASGTVTMYDTSAATTFQVKLWDGTSVIASGQGRTTAVNQPISVSLSGYLATPAGNIRMSVKSGTTTGLIVCNNSGVGNTDSTVSAIRVG